jgi:transposase
MSKARLVITAVVLEGRTQSDVASEYGLTQSWVSKLVARYRREGEAAFEPKSRRPKTSPNKIDRTTIDLILKLRRGLDAQGLDAGPDTICWHLQQHHATRVSPATVSRHLRAAGLVTPEPKKRPKSSYIRFEAAMPNETWQSDFTHYRLTTGQDTEILSWLDDCTRYALRVTAHHRVTAPIVLNQFKNTYKTHEIPASTLTEWGYPHRRSRKGEAWSTPFVSPVAKADEVLSNTNYAGCTFNRRTPDQTTPPPAGK